MNNILEFLKELKYSFPNAGKVFMEGSCFRLHRILKVVYTTAEPCYSYNLGHWITKIDGRYYDINGEIEEEYAKSNYKRYDGEETICQSAYVPTYEGQGISYNKYKQSI